MASRVAWLDASAEEQRRVREVVQLFAQKDTQDELGGRRIVVALADTLFPGTSVLHSRARYLLFIPWFCERASREKQPEKSLDWYERQMITVFRDDPDLTSDERRGLIGIDAGAQVRQLPSTAYWSALSAWGILAWPGSIAETLDRSRHLRGHTAPDDADELADRVQSVWHPGVGEAPTGFPKENLDGAFRLHAHEAEWLRERILATTGDSLLAHLVRTAQPLTAEVMPWDDPACRTAAPEIVADLDDAHRFSVATDGARRLYDLLLAERYAKAGFDRVDADREYYVGRIQDWLDDRRRDAALFEGWDSEDFWARIRTRNPKINHLTSAFFDQWFDVARTAPPDLADDQALRSQIVDRERFLKEGQARLLNDKLLAAWGGGAAAATSFRWSQVVQTVNDLVDGLERSDDDAGA